MAGYLVIGGTGMLGGAVVDRMLAQGATVRVLVRPEQSGRQLRWGTAVEARAAALTDVERLTEAMQGCEGVHLSLQGGPSREQFWAVEVAGARAAAEAARRAGVRRITLISGMGVCALPPGREDDPLEPNYPAQAKWAAEQALIRSGVPYTIFRPTNVIDTFGKFVRSGRAYLLPFDGPPSHWLSAEALAERVVSSYALAEARNRVFALRGPEVLSYSAAADCYFSYAAPDVRVTRLQEWMIRLIALFSPSLRTGLRLMALAKDFAEVDDAEARQVFGPITESVADYCRRLGARRALAKTSTL